MKDIVKSFLIIGQSNMAGRGHLHEVKPIINERIVPNICLSIRS